MFGVELNDESTQTLFTDPDNPWTPLQQTLAPLIADLQKRGTPHLTAPGEVKDEVVLSVKLEFTGSLEDFERMHLEYGGVRITLGQALLPTDDSGNIASESQFLPEGAPEGMYDLATSCHPEICVVDYGHNPFPVDVGLRTSAHLRRTTIDQDILRSGYTINMPAEASLEKPTFLFAPDGLHSPEAWDCYGGTVSTQLQKGIVLLPAAPPGYRGGAVGNDAANSPANADTVPAEHRWAILLPEHPAATVAIADSAHAQCYRTLTTGKSGDLVLMRRHYAEKLCQDIEQEVYATNVLQATDPRTATFEIGPLPHNTWLPERLTYAERTTRHTLILGIRLTYSCFPVNISSRPDIMCFGARALEARRAAAAMAAAAQKKH